MCDSITNGPYVAPASVVATSNVTGNTLSNLNASNLAFGIVSSALILGNTLSNIQSANVTQPFANLVVSNTVTTNNAAVGGALTVTGAMTSNAANTTFFYDTFTIPFINSQVINIAAGNVTTLNVQSLFANSVTIYGSNTLNVFGISNLNSVTANNIITTGSVGIGSATPGAMLDVVTPATPGTGALIAQFGTSATARLQFYDENGGLPPYVYGAAGNGLGLASSGPIQFYTNGNFGTQIMTLNNDGIEAAALMVDDVFATTANVGTLNVATISNLNSLTLSGNLFASRNVVIGPPATSILANLHVEQGDVFIGNSAITNTFTTTTGSLYRLIFDNTTNVSVVPNKIVLYSNAANFVACGFGVSFVGGSASLTYHGRVNHIWYTGTTTNQAEQMRLDSGGRLMLGTTTNGVAKVYIVGTIANTSMRIDSSNIALVTTGSVGFGTLIPSANLHVVGNVYVSNAVTTTNVFANTSVQSGGGLNVGPGTLGSNVVVFSNVSGGSNTFVMDSNGRITIGSTYRGGSLLSFGQTFANKILTLYDVNSADNTTTATNFYGFGIGTLLLRYQVPSTASHVFYGASSEYARITGTGVSILTGANPTANLQVQGNVYVSNALTTTNVFAATVSTTNPIPFRNRIINGGMSIWQRNTASITTTPGIYTTADRWCGALGTSGLLLSQWPGPTEALQFPYSLQVTTSNVSTGVPLVEQHIENLNIPDFLNGTAVSVSFYAGQPYGTLMPLTVGLYYGTVVNNFGVQTLAVAATQNTPTLTASNVYYSMSFTLTSSLGATNGLSLRFTTGGASAVGSTILLTGVQVEKGLLATPFEVRPYATELALCQRYYYQLTSPTAAVQGTSTVYSIFGTATGITTTAFWVPIYFPVPMRNPYYSFSNSAVSNFQLLPTGTTTITSVGLQTDSFTPVGATLNFVGTNITAGGSYIFRTNGLTGSTVAFFGFSCEL